MSKKKQRKWWELDWIDTLVIFFWICISIIHGLSFGFFAGLMMFIATIIIAIQILRSYIMKDLANLYKEHIKKIEKRIK